MAVLYFGEIRRGSKLVESIAAYGNETDEVADRILDRRPLGRGERLVVTDFTGNPLATVEPASLAFARLS